MPKELEAFTAQAAVNFNCYTDWNYEEIDLRASTHELVTASYITPDNPAKKVVIYQKPGTGSGDAGDAYNLLLNIDIVDTGVTLNDSDFNSSEVFGTLSSGMSVDFLGNILALGGTNGLELLGQAMAVGSIAAIRGWGGSTGVAHTNGVKVYGLRELGYQGISDHYSAKNQPPLSDLYTETSSKYPIISLDNGEFPFTLSGTNIYRLHIHNTAPDTSDADDYVSILSLH